MIMSPEFVMVIVILFVWMIFTGNDTPDSMGY